jgi:hypothetical protein
VGGNLPGNTLAEKVSIFQKELAAAAPPTPSTPSTPSPDPIIEEVDEEAPFLAASSLNPFSFSSTAASLSPGSGIVAGASLSPGSGIVAGAPLPSVLVKYDPKLGLGTPSVPSFALLTEPGFAASGDAAGRPAETIYSAFQPARPGVLVPYDPELGTENTLLAHEGGAVMPGLGFRPLGYADAGMVENSSMTHSQAMAYIKFIHGPGSDKLPPRERIENLKSLQNFMQAWENNPEAAIKYATRIQNLVGSIESPPAFDESLIEEGASIPLEDWHQAREEAAGGRRLTDRDMGSTAYRSGESDLNLFNRMGDMFQNPLTSAPTGERVFPGPAHLIDQDLRQEYFQNELTAAPTGERVFREVDETVTPYLQAGGYVDRGTVAGELGRRGRLPVREAGETMFERRKRLEGYAHGGYAENKTRSEEEQRLKEEQGTGTNLAERHEAPNWYELMGKRPTLGPRRRA